MNTDIRLTLLYCFVACILTAAIVLADYESDKQVQSEIGELRGEFCKLINQMHRIRGFEVLDCSRVSLEAIEITPADDAG